MRHLTDEQVVEAADGALSATIAEHLANCDRCASRVRDLQQVLIEVGQVDVPEPSPVFWQQFPANVNAAIQESPSPRESSWLSPWVLGWSAAAALVVLSVIGFQVMRSNREASRPVPVAHAPVQNEPVSAEAASDPYGGDIESDEAWALVRSLAEDLNYDEARDAGVMPKPDAVERAVTELSEEERAELRRLIEHELKQTGA